MDNTEFMCERAATRPQVPQTETKKHADRRDISIVHDQTTKEGIKDDLAESVERVSLLHVDVKAAREEASTDYSGTQKSGR